MGTSVQSGMSPLSCLWAIPMAWVVFWTCQRTFVTFFMDTQFVKEDFAATVIPDGINPDIKTSFWEMIDIFMAPDNIKYYTLRLHIATSFVMMFICMAQIMPFVRRRYMKLHRKLGYAYAALLVLFTIEMSYTTFIKGVALPSRVVSISDCLGLISMIGGTVGGIYFAKQHNVTAHWACMLVNIGGLFHIPVQRVIWLVMSQCRYGAPYSSYQDWIHKTLENAIWLAWGTVYSTCLACIWLQGSSKTATAKKAI